MTWLALDIGGANIKVADGNGYAAAVPFPLWKEPANLTAALRQLIREAPACDRLAITMTGELADCFRSKSEGVRFILAAVTAACDERDVHVYLTDGRFVSPAEAAANPLLAAASNWHALARFAGRFSPQGTALLLDVGSTTCDVIPLLDGQPVAQGKTDTTRLLAGELVYTGIERSPCCAILSQAKYRGHDCPVTQELFATMRDVYLILGELPASDDTQTADGQPATRDAAVRRLGRMLAADELEFSAADAQSLAAQFATAQRTMLVTAIEKVIAAQSQPVEQALLSGHGEFLAVAALATARLRVPVFFLSDTIGTESARSAPAHALAVLAREILT